MSSTLAIPASAANAPPRFSLALPPNIARKQSVSSNQSPAQPAAALPAASSVSVPAPIAAAAGASASGQNAQAGPSTLNRRGSAVAAGGRARSASPAAEEDDDGSDADDDDEGGGGGGAGGGATKKKGGAKKGKKAGDAGAGAQAKEYKYTSEISQMMFVFGEVQDPLPETVRLVEDVVRGQIIEIVTRARLLTHMRNSRFLSAEDLIFLIRDDRSKVNRLRMYLSWKEVRKRAKEDEGADGGPAAAAAGGGAGGGGGSGAGGAGAGDDDPSADGVGGDMDKATLKGRKAMVKLPWEILTPFSDFLRSTAKRDGREDEDDEDEDEIQAYQDSMQRLRDADEITKKMTRDEYVHYSDCRQASFTYRKARRFRNFVNFSAYLEVRPNDDIIDILGFLSFEMVRSLCVTALDVRDRLEKSESGHVATLPFAAATQAAHHSTPAQRKLTLGGGGGGGGTTAPSSHVPAEKRKTADGGAGSSSMNGQTSPSKRAKVDSPEAMNGTLTGHASAPSPSAGGDTSQQQPTPSLAKSAARAQTTSHGAAAHPLQPRRTTPYPVSLFAAPPAARQPLLPAHVLEAFAQIQRNQAAGRGGGVRNFRAGIARPKIALV